MLTAQQKACTPADANMIRKFLSILLASVLLISCFSAGISFFAANKAEADITIVFIAGGNCYLHSADGRLNYVF